MNRKGRNNITNRLEPVPKVSQKHIVLLASLVALGCYVGELAHKWAGVWMQSDIIGTTVWVFLVYFLGLYIAGNFFHWLERRKQFPLRLQRKDFFMESVLLAIVFSIPTLMYRDERIAAIFLACFLLYRFVRHSKRGDLLAVIFAITMGYGMEFIIVSSSLYRYQHAVYLPLPLWSVFFWGGLGFGFRRLFNIGVYSRSSQLK